MTETALSHRTMPLEPVVEPAVEPAVESPDPFRGDRVATCRIALRLDDADRASRRARATINDFYDGRLDPRALGDLLPLSASPICSCWSPSSSRTPWSTVRGVW